MNYGQVNKQLQSILNRRKRDASTSAVKKSVPFFNLSRTSHLTVSVLLILTALSLSLLVQPLSKVRAIDTISREMPFSARMTSTSSGLPVPDGNYTVTFRFFTVASGGTAVWSESQTIAVTGGVLFARLGSVTALPDDFRFNGSEYYLEAQVSGEEAMSPRRRVGAVPTAINADTVGGARAGTGANNVLKLNSSGNISIAGEIQGGAIDRESTGALAIGATNATTINIGRSGQTQALLGNATVAGTLGITGATTISKSAANALALTGTPAESASASLLQLGSAISNGSSSGTYISINADSTYAGDLLNLQVDNASKFKVTSTGLQIGGTILPSTTGTYDLGSSSLRFANAYINNLVVGQTSTSGTSSTSFTINDQATGAADSSLVFYRGGTLTSGVLLWNDTTDSFDFNFPIRNLTTVPATANYGQLSLGNNSTAFDGSTSGYFVGSSSGTFIAVNAPTGFAGNLIDLQVAGSSKFSVTTAGNTAVGGTLAVTGTAAFDTNVLYVDATNNNVGIGTTSTSTGRLTIAGSGAFNATNAARIALSNSVIGTDYVLHASDTGAFQVAYGINTRFFIDSAGNTSIGGTTSNARLTVSGSGAFAASAAAQFSLLNSTFGSGFTQHVSDSGVWQLASTAASSTKITVAAGINGAIDFYNGTGNIVTQGTGNFGIGDTSPAALLTVGSGDLFQIASNGNLTSSNAGTWTLSNDTNFALSGGVNGVSFDSSTLSVDATNDRVGIGTTAPTSLLEVSGVTRPTITLQDTDIAAKGRLTAAVDNYLALTQNISFDGTNWNPDYASTPGWLLKLDPRTGADRFEVVRFAGSDLNSRTYNPLLTLDGDGDLGIGIETPGVFASATDAARNLHVKGSASESTRLQIESGATSGNVALALIEGDQTTNSKIFSMALDGGVFRLSSVNDDGSDKYASLLSANGSGYIGVGTAAVTDTKLKVLGHVTAGNWAMRVVNSADTANLFGIYQDTQGSDPSFFFYDASGNIDILLETDTGTGRHTYFNTGNNFGIGDTSPAALLTVGSGDLFQVNSSGAIAAVAGITSSSNYVQSAGTFSLTSANTTQTTTSSAMALNLNSLTTGTGLYAASSTLSTGKLVDLQISGTAAGNGQTALNILTTGTNGSTVSTYGAQISNTHTAFNAVNYGLAVTTSGGASNYAAVFSGGNVGIGTTEPGFDLVVALSNSSTTQLGSDSLALRVANTDTTNNNWVDISFADNASGAGAANISAKLVDHTNDYADLYFGTRSASGFTNKLSILSAGNVGVGTDSPKATLQVADATAIFSPAAGTSSIASLGRNVYYDSGAAAYKRIVADNEAPLIQLTNTGEIQFWRATDAGTTADSTITYGQSMVIDNSGNVGIGTTSPSTNTKLDIIGASSSTGLVQIGASSGSATDLVLRINRDTSPATEAFSVNRNGLVTITTADSGTSLTTTGPVGIGTTGPTSNLHITGNRSRSAWGTAGVHLQAAAITGTDESTAASGTAASAVFVSFAQPTLAATNTGVTTTDAATVYIANAPTAGTNQTITNPYALWIDDGNVRIDGEVTLTLDGTASTTAICGSHAGGTSGDVASVTLRDCSGAPAADYAEMYPVASDVTYGDLLALGDNQVTTKDGAKITQLVKANSSTRTKVIGIASDNYGDFTSAGYNVKESDNPKPVALNGRVPVKVAADSPAITKGDLLTISSTSGRATKATSAGWVIGRALTDWNPGEDQVMVYVTNAWADPNYGLASDTLQSAKIITEAIESPAGKDLTITTGVLTVDAQLVVNKMVTLKNRLVLPASATQIVHGGDTIEPNAAKIKVGGAGSAIVMTSTPTIPDSEEGQLLIIQGADESNTVSFQDQSILAGSNLELGAASRILGKGDILTLTYDAADSVWYEVSYTDN